MFGGGRVFNTVAAGAPDKGDAMLRLAADGRRPATIDIGDDENDEPQRRMHGLNAFDA